MKKQTETNKKRHLKQQALRKKLAKKRVGKK